MPSAPRVLFFDCRGGEFDRIEYLFELVLVNLREPNGIRSVFGDLRKPFCKLLRPQLPRLMVPLVADDLEDIHCLKIDRRISHIHEMSYFVEENHPKF